MSSFYFPLLFLSLKCRIVIETTNLRFCETRTCIFRVVSGKTIQKKCVTYTLEVFATVLFFLEIISKTLLNILILWWKTGLRQLHVYFSGKWSCQLATKTLWKDPNARSRWGSPLQHTERWGGHHQYSRRSHRYDCQRLQLSVQFLVMEVAPSPSTPAGFHL